MAHAAADILREYGPFPGVARVNGVTFDGRRVWFASVDRLHALDPQAGSLTDAIEVPAHAGTAFDGRYLFQIGDDTIQKIDPHTGQVLATIPVPEGGGSGLAWADGMLWMGQYRARRILQIDPQSGAVLRTIECQRFVTGVTWVEGDLWHGDSDGGHSALVRIEPQTGEVRDSLALPDGVAVSGLECDGAETFFCGGAGSGTIRAVRRPKV